MTVSKVARGCPDVARATRSRVLARINELGYQPDWMARSLAMGRTFKIGLILPDLTEVRHNHSLTVVARNGSRGFYGTCWYEKAGLPRDALSSQLRTHSKCKKETGYEEA